MAESVGFEPTVPLRAHTISSRAQSSTLATLRSEPTGEGSPAVRSWRCHKYVAERVGFEPTMELPPYRFSRPAHSSALPSLRDAYGKIIAQRLSRDFRHKPAAGS